MKPLIIGIDPASTRIAFVTRNPVVDTYAIAKYLLGKRFSPECCAEAFDASLEYLDTVSKMAPSGTERIAWIEQATSGKVNHQSLAKQAYVCGAVQAALLKSGFSVHYVAPSSWKAALVSGRATKKDVVRAVRIRKPKLGRIIDGDEDLSDAAGIQFYGETVYERSQGLFD